MNLALQSSLPIEVKVVLTVDDDRLTTKLSSEKITKFIEKSFFYTILGWTLSDLGRLDDPPKAYVRKSQGPLKMKNSLTLRELRVIVQKVNASMEVL